jgi:hypothetical protein
MDVQELVSLNRKAIDCLPRDEQAGALRRLLAIVEGDDVEAELEAFTRHLQRQIAENGGDDQVEPLSVEQEDIEADEEADRDEAAGAYLPTTAEIEAKYKRRGLL